MGVFISYRRKDSDTVTYRIFDKLCPRYGSSNVFIDIDNIPLGTNFKEQIDKVLNGCDIVLAIIGPKWMGASRFKSRFRIHDDNDFVRVELSTALKRNIRVIPILIDGTRMPDAIKLPDDLKSLVLHQGITVDSKKDFHTHLNRLMKEMDGIIKVNDGGSFNDENDGSAYSDSMAIMDVKTAVHKYKVIDRAFLAFNLLVGYIIPAAAVLLTFPSLWTSATTTGHISFMQSHFSYYKLLFSAGVGVYLVIITIYLKILRTERIKPISQVDTSLAKNLFKRGSPLLSLFWYLNFSRHKLGFSTIRRTTIIYSTFIMVLSFVAFISTPWVNQLVVWEKLLDVAH
jgi:TIR domain